MGGGENLRRRRLKTGAGMNIIFLGVSGVSGAQSGDRRDV